MDRERINPPAWPVDWPVKVQVNHKNSLKNFYGHIKNISLKEIGLTLNKQIPHIDNLRLKLFLAVDVSLVVRGKVVSHQPLPDGLHFYALEIVFIRDSDKELICRLIHDKYFPQLIKQWWKGIDK